MKEREIRTAPHAPRCTNATVEALTGHMPQQLLIYGTSVLQELRRLGYSAQPLHLVPRTLRSLMHADLPGSYFVSTAGHAMALVDGVLTDTEAKGYNMRRITCMFKVERMES
jgi:hypothetical protein